MRYIMDSLDESGSGMYNIQVITFLILSGAHRDVEDFGMKFDF